MYFVFSLNFFSIWTVEQIVRKGFGHLLILLFFQTFVQDCFDYYLALFHFLSHFKRILSLGWLFIDHLKVGFWF